MIKSTIFFLPSVNSIETAKNKKKTKQKKQKQKTAILVLRISNLSLIK